MCKVGVSFYYLFDTLDKKKCFLRVFVAIFLSLSIIYFSFISLAKNKWINKNRKKVKNKTKKKHFYFQMNFIFLIIYQYVNFILSFLFLFFSSIQKFISMSICFAWCWKMAASHGIFWFAQLKQKEMTRFLQLPVNLWRKKDFQKKKVM